MSEVEIHNIDGVDVVKYLPQGVCSKLMQIRIKDNIILDAEFVGGCAGNLSGIAMLIRGMNIEEVIKRTSGLPCGSKPTSCPDQLSKALSAYLTEKQAVKA